MPSKSLASSASTNSSIVALVSEAVEGATANRTFMVLMVAGGAPHA